MKRLVQLFLVLASIFRLAAESQQISLRLFVPQSTICKGASELQVELEMRNIGSAPVEISTAAVGHGFDAMALYSTESNVARFESLQVTGDRITRPARRSMMVQPRAAHTLQGAIVLDGAFFSEPGFYRIRTDYFERREDAGAGQSRAAVHATSNWVILQVESCSAGSKATP